ncbi:hypothetical protein [Rubrivivax gelatinosus]|uniref:hypothetical protein n=1 Tax=Rubrivivax gelatinosus TaxID=28068 RepID=UPI001902FD68|nr:hypothetical protein [Rubrivivax gelatinosus]
MNIMKGHREVVIETAVADADLPREFANRLVVNAPWLDGTEELNEELAPELLADEAFDFGVSLNKIRELVDRYNTLVQAHSNPHTLRQNEAYVEIGQALAEYGRADAFGEGDYWLVDDSFSTRNPVILVYEGFRLPPAALSKLQDLVDVYNGVFSELRINTDFGAEVATLRPR